MNKLRLGPTTKLFPMPVLLLVVKTGETTASVLTVVWAGVVGSGPVTVALRIGGFHYSAPFIDREMSFSLNVPSSRQAVGVDYCGTVSGHQDPDKLRTCGWTMVPSAVISSPLIAECPLNFECRVLEKTPVGKGAIYLAEVVETHVSEELLKEPPAIDAALLDPLVYAPDGCYYRLGERVGRERSLARTIRNPT
jgi:flavin reductase (DIM6/NTAB) family NADH-FMN oxidoreductase RutF